MKATVPGQSVACFGCGLDIQGPGAWVLSASTRFLDPVFCSEACARNYVPQRLDMAKLRGLHRWLDLTNENHDTSHQRQSDPETRGSV